MTETKADDQLAEMRELLQGGTFRLEVCERFSLSTGRSFPGVLLFRQQGKRWVKVGPVLMPNEGEGLPELLRLIASLAETHVSERGSRE